jgi:hypothetical protein
MQITAVAAAPGHLRVAFEHASGFDVGRQIEITLFVSMVL